MGSIIKYNGEWCIEGWPVRTLADHARRVGIHRAAGNISSIYHKITPEQAQEALDFIPPREPGLPTLLNSYHGNGDCTCGQRFSLLHGKGTCHFCGQEWIVTLTVSAVHPFTVSEPIS